MNDHLDKSTSVSVELTETGVKAKARSRFVAAIDRLGGNFVELANAPIERRISRQRAVSEGESKLIQAVTDFGIEKLNRDPEFAQRTAEKYFERIFEKQNNKDRVLLEALEDLRHAPPDDELAAAGEERLSDEFLSRFESYAEGASTEQLRQKWGRVLSSEVRKPGRFSAKVLRTIDEIDSDAAVLFEKLAAGTIQDCLAKCLVGKLPFSELSQLIMAGLILDPGITGHVLQFSSEKTASGQEVWVLLSPEQGVSISKSIRIPPDNPSETAPLVSSNENRPAIPVYILTDAGKAISTIFAKPKPTALSRYIALLRSVFPTVEVIEYVRLQGTDQFAPITPAPTIKMNISFS